MFDPTKPCTFRGKPVRIICTDRKGIFPIVYLFFVPEGCEAIGYAKPDGNTTCSTPLVNVPERVSRFYNTYKSGAMGGGYPSVEAARKGALGIAICVTEIIYEDDIPVNKKVHMNSA